MALTKLQKKDAMQGYVQLAKNAKNVALIVQKGIQVNDTNDLRRSLVSVWGKVQVVRKRIFLRAAQEAGFSVSELGKVEWSIIALYATGDEYAPLKEVDKMNKSFKKAFRKCAFEYAGGWYDKSRKDGAFVATLATLPSKEELIGKFLFLLNYPVQSFTVALDKIREQKEGK